METRTIKSSWVLLAIVSFSILISNEKEREISEEGKSPQMVNTALDSSILPSSHIAEGTESRKEIEYFEGWEPATADLSSQLTPESTLAKESKDTGFTPIDPPESEEKVEYFEGWEKLDYFEGWEPEIHMADAPISQEMENEDYWEATAKNESEEKDENTYAASEKSEEPCSTDINNNQDTKVIIEDTRGLVLVDDEHHLYDKERLKEVSGLAISHLQLPGSVSDLEKRLNPIYQGKPLTLQVIRDLKNTINNYFIDSGFPFTMVKVPKQCISTKVLQLIVCQSRLGKIVVEGTKWTRPSLFTQYIKTIPGECILSSSMTRDVNFINRNPYRRVNAIYAAGDEPCTTDLILAVDERKPYRIYGGADNTGPVRIRRQRVYGGIGMSRMFGFDHYLNFQYTSSYNNKAFQGYTGQYVMFFPIQHVLNIFGGYSVITSNLPFPATNNRGVFIQGSCRYTIPSVISQKFPIEISAGFDFKRTNTTLLFQQAFNTQFPNTSQAANLSQFSLDLRSSYQGTYSRVEWVGELYFSPCEMLPDEKSAQYSALRPGASPSYIYGRFATKYTQWLPLDFEAFLWLRGQVSSAALLPSEQYGIGGHDTVRGYDEFQLAMDNALNVNFELRTPPIQLISQIRKMPMKDAIQFLIFYDYGVGMNKISEPGERSPSYLMSFGPGFRYTLDPYVAIRFDWGWKLKKAPNNSNLPAYSGGDSMVHFNATLSY